MVRVALITGASSGIGLALCKNFLTNNTDITIIAVCRDRSKLDDLAGQFAGRLRIVVADISIDEGRTTIVETIKDLPTIDYLVHCAAVVTPLSQLQKINYIDWQICLQTNVDAPVFLTLKLLKQLSYSRVLFLTSDATLQPVYGAASYCVSKMALHMAYACLKTEISIEKTVFGLVAPGNVDTPMQKRIRMTDPKDLPIATAMTDVYEKNRLLTPEIVASYLSKLLLVLSREVFESKCWNIYEDLQLP
tara:strand:- start:741 stop:1484 length:744 start_codon:yes stop_codon:yes gene_type:complete